MRADRRLVRASLRISYPLSQHMGKTYQEITRWRQGSSGLIPMVWN